LNRSLISSGVILGEIRFHGNLLNLAGWCEFLVPAQSVFTKHFIELSWDDFHVSGIPEIWNIEGSQAKKHAAARALG
jgi:hypothetical protein